ncbi:hypothetical protein BB560_000856 [Smittium megazygosporum]|uniref:HMG box domain-containing protein n=1 Tax=Smittium megazygosporum TaxID=133381 RepID=A0A2T9ZJ51_9FUNG|nr:hypothetical protein BB560_000856 [Smittium megazygosporum]
MPSIEDDIKEEESEKELSRIFPLSKRGSREYQETGKCIGEGIRIEEDHQNVNFDKKEGNKCRAEKEATCRKVEEKRSGNQGKTETENDTSGKLEKKQVFEAFKNLQNQWKSLSEEEKAIYEKKADEANAERIKQAKEWWDNVDPELVKLENLRIDRINVKRKEQGLKREGKVKNPFFNGGKPAYAAFVKDMYSQNIVSGNPIENSKHVSEIWKTLSQQEKDFYRQSVSTNS